jgi:peptide/nickel transport system permease protein
MIAPFLRPLALLAQFVLLALLVLFLMMRAAPGGPVAWFTGPTAPVAERSAMAGALAVDRAPHVQFLRVSGRVLRGDLGRSARSGAPVLPVVATALAGSVALLLLAGVLAALVVTMVQGLLAAAGASLLGRIVAACALAGLMAQVPLGIMIARFAPDTMFHGPGAPIVALLPGAALLALLVAGLMTLDLRRLLRERMTSPSAVMARTRGFGRWTRLRREALPSALPRLARDMVVALPRLIGLTLVVEALVTGTGLGALTLTALAHRDIPLLAGKALVLLALGLALRALVASTSVMRWRLR